MPGMNQTVKTNGSTALQLSRPAETLKWLLNGHYSPCISRNSQESSIMRMYLFFCRSVFFVISFFFSFSSTFLSVVFVDLFLFLPEKRLAQKTPDFLPQHHFK